jgi:hypothetical protein
MTDNSSRIINFVNNTDDEVVIVFTVGGDFPGNPQNLGEWGFLNNLLKTKPLSNSPAVVNPDKAEGTSYPSQIVIGVIPPNSPLPIRFPLIKKVAGGQGGCSFDSSADECLGSFKATFYKNGTLTKEILKQGTLLEATFKTTDANTPQINDFYDISIIPSGTCSGHMNEKATNHGSWCDVNCAPTCKEAKYNGNTYSYDINTEYPAPSPALKKSIIYSPCVPSCAITPAGRNEAAKCRKSNHRFICGLPQFGFNSRNGELPPAPLCLSPLSPPTPCTAPPAGSPPFPGHCLKWNEKTIETTMNEAWRCGILQATNNLTNNKVLVGPNYNLTFGPGTKSNTKENFETNSDICTGNCVTGPKACSLSTSTNPSYCCLDKKGGCYSKPPDTTACHKFCKMPTLSPAPGKSTPCTSETGCKQSGYCCYKGPGVPPSKNSTSSPWDTTKCDNQCNMPPGPAPGGEEACQGERAGDFCCLDGNTPSPKGQPYCQSPNPYKYSDGCYKQCNARICPTIKVLAPKADTNLDRFNWDVYKLYKRGDFSTYVYPYGEELDAISDVSINCSEINSQSNEYYDVGDLVAGISKSNGKFSLTLPSHPSNPIVYPLYEAQIHSLGQGPSGPIAPAPSPSSPSSSHIDWPLILGIGGGVLVLIIIIIITVVSNKKKSSKVLPHK